MSYHRESIPLNQAGMNLINPLSEIPDDRFAFALNVRTDYGVPEARKQLGLLLELTGAGSTSLIKNIFRLNYPLLSKRFIVAGEHVYYYDITSGILTYIENGWESISSAKSKWPSAVYIRPEESIYPWLYITNAGGNKFKKFSVEADYQDVGIAVPQNPSLVEEDTPKWKTIDEMGSTVANWTGVGLTVTPPVAINRINQTISNIIYDSGSTGFCSIVPNSMPKALQTGTQIALSGGPENVEIDDVLPSVLVLGTATVQSVKYNSGSTGKCTIHLTVVPDTLKSNCILRFNGAIVCRVLEIITGNNNQKSIVVDSGASTIAAGHSVEGLASFRTYTINTHVAAETITTDAMRCQIAASGISTVTRIFNNDLSIIGSGSSARPTTDNDYVVVGILVSDQTKLKEIHLKFNIADPAGGTRFQSDYFYYAINPSALVPSTDFSISMLEALQRQRQRYQIISQRQLSRADITSLEGLTGSNYLITDNYPIDRDDFPIIPDDFVPPVVNETSLGNYVWSVFKIRKGDFVRAGRDESRGWKDIDAIQFSFDTTAAIDIYVDSLLMEGSFDLDSSDFDATQLAPYYYIYRYRSSKTRAVSNWSPPQRAGLSLSRRRAKITFTPSSDTQVDKIDIARFGGRLKNFYYIGTKENDANPYFDNTPDSLAIKNPVVTFDNYKPFAVLDKSRKGTCNVIGNRITKLTGDNFDIRWARGSQIIVDGVVNRLYTNPSSTLEAELETSVGTLSNVTFYLPEPLLVGVVLPRIFGPYGEGNLGLFIFGIGYENAAGTLYWLNGNSPDVMSDLNYLEITSPSEPLTDGFILKGVPYVCSSERIFEILATFSNGRIEFFARQVGGIKGIIGDVIVGTDAAYFSSKDGIYEFDGSKIVSISDEIQTVMPRFGLPPTSFQAVYTCPSIDPTNSNFQLEVFEDKLLVRTVGISANPIYFYIFDIKKRAWILDSYQLDTNKPINVAITERGEDRNRLLFGSEGKIYTYIDDISLSKEVGFVMRFVTKSYGFGNGRLMKEFGDALIEYEANDSKSIYVTPLIDEKTLALVETIVPTTAYPIIEKEEAIIELITVEDEQLTNAKRLAFIVETEGIGFKINNFHITYDIYPDKSDMRFSTWEDSNRKGSKFVKTVIIDAITQDEKTFQIQKEGGISLGNITINHHNIRARKAYSIPKPTYASIIRLVPQDGEPWQLFGFDVEFDEAPEETSSPTDWVNSDIIGEKLVKGLILDADTEGNIVDIEIQKDGEIVAVTIPIQHDKRIEKVYDFENPITGSPFGPFLAHNLRIVPKDNMRIFEFKFIVEKWAEFGIIPTDFDNGGTPVLKYLQRIELDADTEGEDVSINIEDGYGNALATITNVNHLNRKIVSYSLNPPVEGYLFRLVPDKNIRIFGVRYLFDLQPPKAKHYRAQPTTFDIPGFKIVRKAFLTIRSIDDITFRLVIDNVNYDYDIPSTSGIVEKIEIPLKTIKGKIFEPIIFSDSNLSVYEKDCEFHVLSINSGEVQIKNPLGHIHREIGTA